MATPSLLSRVIESQGQDAELVSIRDRVTHPHPLLAAGVPDTPQKFPVVTSND